ncbi:tetratricopeptide repeat protein [Actinoplanes sp. LDG1-06]|uniref:Tetratricopeptide repeat protein n=2 Tax=Paractinoplanes ovalisporus TaxID=2810368 RepID=A0ABS2A2J3_9ACTN|nr:tetratricopeptide repeat protein [Actinoplanes ovalisporus]
MLRRLKVWAGDPSYETIRRRVNATWSARGRPPGELTVRPTVANCFRPGRRRVNNDLVLAIVEVLHPDGGYVTQWRQALRILGGEAEAVSQVRVQAALPPDPAGFAGRTGELARLRAAVRSGSPVLVEGMAGVGKTHLVVHVGHDLARDDAYDQVLFVNLRGFHPDPAQPPADPGAVLDGFLRLLGVPGHRIPHDVTACVAAYRSRLAGRRVLVVLDDAATVDQIRPLLPRTPGCVTLITSRRHLAGLRRVTRVPVGVFTPAEATAYVTSAVPGMPVGSDPLAADHVAQRCGYLPLALSLVVGHMRGAAGWTLTDHAERLDDRHRDRRLDSAVENALAMSYHHLAAGTRRLLRLSALHPGQDFDAYAAAALAGSELATAVAALDLLHRDSLVQRIAADRYAFHDLIRAYAAGRAHDEDPPAVRRDALTRLFDQYLATSVSAMAVLHPAEACRRPAGSVAGRTGPELTDAAAAMRWLDAERTNLVAAAIHTAHHGWPDHTTRLAHVLYRYFQGGHHTDALILHEQALQAARRNDDLAGQAHALIDLGVAHTRQARRARATGHLRHALKLFRLARDRKGEARALNHLGFIAEQTGRLPEATRYYRKALDLARRAGHQGAEAFARNGLGVVDTRQGAYAGAAENLHRALTLCRQRGNRVGEAAALDSLGLLHSRTGRAGPAISLHEQALVITREIGDQDAETYVLNGLGEAALVAGRPVESAGHHAAARALATRIGAPTQRARAYAGLGRAYQALGRIELARDHYRHAVAVHAELGTPEAGETRARLAELDGPRPAPPTRRGAWSSRCGR